LSNAKKNVFQSTNNLDNKINPKTSNKSKTLCQTSTQIKIPRLYPCDKNQKQNLQNFKERLSISENQSKAIFKLINQSNTGIKSSSQATEAILGEKRKIDLLQQILQEAPQSDSRAECDEQRSSQATNRTQCDVAALVFTSRVRRLRFVAGCIYGLV
jgi:hypothetical protein